VDLVVAHANAEDGRVGAKVSLRGENADLSYPKAPRPPQTENGARAYFPN
jgi:hypothetical protein